MDNIEIWHDEYRGDGTKDEYWHGLFFVPTSARENLLNSLRAIRDEHNISYSKDIKFASSLNSDKTSRLISNQLSLFVHSLIVKEKEAKTQLFNRDGAKKYHKDFKPFASLNGVMGCKFILFKIPNNHKEFNSENLSYSELVETTFRFALRSGLHYLINEDVTITKFYFDGHEHHGRNIDISRITRGVFREHVRLAEDLSIDDRQMKDRDDDTKLIMCLVDNAVGGLTAKISEAKDKYGALFPVEGIVERERSGTLNVNTNGRWYKSLSIFQMTFVDGAYDFSPLVLDDGQISLF